LKTYKPFEGLRVLELASVLAGPLAGSFFAEGGATVIKVEHPKLGDVTRTWRSVTEDKEDPISAYYAAANTYKNVYRVDLITQEGQVWLLEELGKCDILLHNFKEKDLTKFNLVPAEIADKFPQLIHIRLLGFASQPERLAYDVVVQAETGFMHMNGEKHGEATKMPVAMMDILASHQIRSAALSGLYAREKGKRGWFAEVSLELSGIAALANQATNYLMNASVPQRQGSLHPNIAPYGEQLHLDGGSIVLAVGSDSQFSSLCQILNCVEFITDERFCNNQARVKNRSILVKELQELAAAHSRNSLLTAFNSKGVPAGAIKDLKEVFSEGTPGARAVIHEKIEGANRILKKPRTTAYSVTIFGNNIE
jgi:crotonobetainyl-CoA:carnitine CoA-transferase CaiB-like acyl-CoA transferase